MEIDESKEGESWIQGLTEGEYHDLSVEERLNALIALTSIANEGNSIRLVLEVVSHPVLYMEFIHDIYWRILILIIMVI